MFKTQKENLQDFFKTRGLFIYYELTAAGISLILMSKNIQPNILPLKIKILKTTDKFHSY